MGEASDLYKEIKETITKDGIASYGSLVLIGFAIIWGCEHLNQYLNKHFTTKERVLGCGIILAVWILFWLFKRFYLPRNRKNKIGFVIALKTENSDEEERLKSDFSESIERLLRDHGLGHLFNLMVVPRHQCGASNREKYLRETNGHFLLVGKSVKRLDGQETKRFIEIEGLVKHQQTVPEVKSALSRHFGLALKRDYEFSESGDFRGLRLTAEACTQAAIFIVGIAAFISQDYGLALQLHESLKVPNQYFSKTPEGLFILRNVLPFLSEENWRLARTAFWKEDWKLVIIHANKSIETQLNTYRALTLRAVAEFELLYIEDAIKTIRLAKTHAGNNDNEWIHSLAFLHLWQKDWPSFLSMFQRVRRIKRNPYDTKSERQMIKHTERTIRKFPEKIQLHLWTGYFYYSIGELSEANKYFKVLKKNKHKFPTKIQDLIDHYAERLNT